MHAPTLPQIGLMLLAIASMSAQVAPVPAPDPAMLARYDKNQNGRLDPDERAAMEADSKKVGPVVAVVTREEAVVLSPFEVVADTKGYYAANTMAGTRLNSKLDDLASAISVITKEQTADFAMLDVNDVFLYAANTEGTGTYTDMLESSGNGGVTDNVAGDPANANRVRGIGSANISNGNFATSNRVPIDPVDADGVEISRGPNTNIFGLGNTAGAGHVKIYLDGAETPGLDLPFRDYLNHTLSVELLGKHSDATQTGFGLDFIKLVPVP